MPYGKKTFLILGDIALDNYIIPGERNFSDSPGTKPGTRTASLKGGAFLIYSFLSGFEGPEYVCFGHDPKLFNKLPGQNCSYASLDCFKEKDRKIWKINQQFGFGTFTGKFVYPPVDKSRKLPGPDIVVIDDAGMDFGSHTNRKAWPSMGSLCMRSVSNPDGPVMVICKKSGDIGKGELWMELLEDSVRGNINLVTVVSVNDIRKQDARISTKISWEQTALDLVYELKTNSRLAALKNTNFLVVNVGTAGALLVIRKPDGSMIYRLIFDPKNLENEWEGSRQGGVIGLMSCFTAAFASSLDLTRAGDDYRMEDSIKSGLAAVRRFIETGYLVSPKGIGLPAREIRDAAPGQAVSFSSAFIPSPEDDPSFLNRKWNILLDNYRSSGIPADGPLYAIARNVALNGPIVLNNIPSLSLRKLFTVDRTEIESFRIIRKLIESYKVQKSFSNPLSIAVFGPPGSGKSFGVREIAKGVLGHETPFLEFNISQFSGPADLIGAFHQVRDEVLKGAIPVVFWDEFDSKEYDYLQYLLAPMQDGTFQEGQITHTLGKCIMVFAGATCPGMQTFVNLGKSGDPQKAALFRYKKGPDFASRMHGYINVLGPNQTMMTTPELECLPDPSDLCFPIRRALFIRSILGLSATDHPEIDHGLLNALIKADKYSHGARSLTNLLKTLKENSGGRKILRSHLPGNQVLELYVGDVSSFLKSMNESQLVQENIEPIARAIHYAWKSAAKAKNPEYVAEYEILPVFIKASNVDAAARIPIVLGKAGLKVISAAGDGVLSKEQYLRLIKKDGNKILEIMAGEEHRLWCEFYYRNDWRYGEIRDDYSKVHNCLVDYDDPRLSEDDRDKDRDQVARYREFLEKVGLGIVKE